MGQATQRKKAISNWMASLNEEQQKVADTAIRLFYKFPLDGACYHTVFFMHLYLKDRFGILTKPIVGFMNDGTDNIYSSHAWLCYRETKTDVAGARPQYPEYQQRASALILDYVYVPGWSGYTYHAERPDEGEALLQDLLADPRSRDAAKNAINIHENMLECSNSIEKMRKYLVAAPYGMNFDAMQALVLD